MLKVLSLFSGIGAFEKALDNLKVPYELTAFCEFDKYAVKSYCAIHGVEESKNLGDITKVDETKLPKDIDILTYGFPCQDISLAGKQQGLFNDDGSQTRSGLFFEALRIIEATKPKIAIAENVKNLVSKKFNAQFQVVMASLESVGYNCYWQVMNAKEYGIPQNRERVFIVSIRKDIDTGLFEFPKPFPLTKRLKDILETEVDEKYYLSEKMVEYLGAITEKNKARGNGNVYSPTDPDGVSKTITTKEGSRVKDNFIEEPMPIRLGNIYGEHCGTGYAGNVWDKDGISPTLMTMQGGNRQPFITVDGKSVKVREATKTGYVEAVDGDSINLEQPNSTTRRGRVGKQMAQTLTTTPQQGAVVSEPQALRQVRTEYGKEIRKAYESGETQEKWGSMKQFEPRTDGVTNTLSTVQKDNYIVEPTVAKCVGGIGEKKSNGGTQYYQQDRIYHGDVALAHPASIPGGSYHYVVEEPVAYDEQNRYIRKDGCVGTIMTDGSSPKKNNRIIVSDDEVSCLRIRKLTPKECFRLMGFDDESFHRAEAVSSNTQLYKQAGNSIVVDVLEELFCMMLDEDGNIYV